MLGLWCCTRAFSSCGKQTLLSRIWGPLIAVASPVAEHELWAPGCGTRSQVVAPRPRSTSSMAVARGLSCFTAWGIFPEQGRNPCPLHWPVVLTAGPPRKAFHPDLKCFFSSSVKNTIGDLIGITLDL